MVRARPADDEHGDTDLEIDRQADQLLELLAASELVAESSTHIAGKVEDLIREQRQQSRHSGRSRKTSAEARAFESMILRAANVVFATTNSGAVEHLIDERGFFDWSIIEEAGKATGPELLSPLLLSHRRLMIGDHKQLPPFGADKLSKLLADPVSVRAAVRASESLIARQLKDPGMEEIFDEVDADDIDYGRLCAEALDILTLFGNMVETQSAWQFEHQTQKPIALQLSEQHRMHPAIAKIVSDCFYSGKLVTNTEKITEYRTNNPPFISLDAKVLPETPIVFVDLPYVREEIYARGGDRPPAWWNQEEVDAVVKTLGLIKARGSKRNTLAVLSPYQQQVQRLQTTIGRKLNGALANLAEFKPAGGRADFCSTVDSFQGDQADLVVVSMVRNNWHTIPAKALGFLRDDRRMNVLLSRAKWKLVLIGSLSFYETIVQLSKSIPDADVGFLDRFLKALESARTAGDASIIRWSKPTKASR